MIGRNTVAVFWKAGNGLFLDPGPDYTDVYFYKLCKPTDVFLWILMYLRF